MLSAVRPYNVAMLGEVLTAIVTPFREDGAVDLELFRRLCAHLVENGSDGLVVAGTTGESPTLKDEEKLALFEAAVDAVGDTAKVDRGHGLERHGPLRAPDRAGARARASTAFSRSRRTTTSLRSAAIVAHFAAIAEATDRPIIVYNIPQRCVVNIEPETIVELAGIPNIAAVKQATTDLEQARRIVDDAGLDLYAGNDDLMLPFLELGGVGGVCVLHASRRPAGEGDDRAVQGGRSRRRARDRHGARAGARRARGDDEPDPGQGRSRHDRPGRRRPAPPAASRRPTTRRPRFAPVSSARRFWRPLAAAPLGQAPRARGPAPRGAPRGVGHGAGRSQGGARGAARRMARCRPEQPASSRSAGSARWERT